MKKHYDIVISGKVQGVFYRASAKKIAELLGVTGTVRNEPNGDVFAEAEGDEEMLIKFIQWCHHGPSNAIVKHVSVREGVIFGYKQFTISGKE